MNEETVFFTEVYDSVSTEPSAVETESSVVETTEPEVAETTVPVTIPATEATEPAETVAPETLPQVILDYIAETEPTETTETNEILMDDLVDLTAESTSILANIILCGALMIVGVLCGIRFWR